MCIYMCSSYCYMLACIGYYMWNGWKIDINKDRLHLQQETIIGRGSCNCDIYMLTANIRHQIYTNSNSACPHMYYIYVQLLFNYTLVIWLTWYILIIRQYYWGYPASIWNGITARRAVHWELSVLTVCLLRSIPPKTATKAYTSMNETTCQFPLWTIWELKSHAMHAMILWFSVFLRNQAAERSMDRPGHSQVSCSWSLMFLSEVCHSLLLLAPKTHRLHNYIFTY